MTLKRSCASLSAAPVKSAFCSLEICVASCELHEPPDTAKRGCERADGADGDGGDCSLHAVMIVTSASALISLRVKQCTGCLLRRCRMDHPALRAVVPRTQKPGDMKREERRSATGGGGESV